MDDPRDGKGAILIVLGLIQIRMTAQDKGCAGSERTHGSGTGMLFFCYLQCLQLIFSDTLSLHTV